MVYRIPNDIKAYGAKQYVLGKSVHLAQYESEGLQLSKPTFLTEHALIFILKGSKTIYREGMKMEVNQHSFMLLKRGFYLMCEKLDEDKPYKSLAIYFNEAWIRQFRERFFQVFPHSGTTGPKLRVAQTSPIHDDFINGLTKLLHYHGRHFDSLTANKLEELLLLLSDSVSSCSLSDFISEIFTSDYQQIEQVVMENLFNPLNLVDLAQLSGCSLSTFKRRFKEIFGAAPNKWIREKRLEHGKVLIDTTNCTVNEIAYKCGFDDTSYFIKSYKKYFGVTPKGKVNR